MSGQVHAPVALPQRKSPLYTLGRRLGIPQGRSGFIRRLLLYKIRLHTEHIYSCSVYSLYNSNLPLPSHLLRFRVPSYRGVARPPGVDGADGHQIRRIAADVPS
jgi:hypothetical protein